MLGWSVTSTNKTVWESKCWSECNRAEHVPLHIRQHGVCPDSLKLGLSVCCASSALDVEAQSPSASNVDAWIRRTLRMSFREEDVVISRWRRQPSVSSGILWLWWPAPRSRCSDVWSPTPSPHDPADGQSDRAHHLFIQWTSSIGQFIQFDPCVNPLKGNGHRRVT